MSGIFLKFWKFDLDKLLDWEIVREFSFGFLTLGLGNIPVFAEDNSMKFLYEISGVRKTSFPLILDLSFKLERVRWISCSMR